jgi:hypothetical protein
LCVERLTSEIFIEKGEELFKISLTDLLLLSVFNDGFVELRSKFVGGIYIGFDWIFNCWFIYQDTKIFSQKLMFSNVPHSRQKFHQNFSLKKSGNPSSRSINF